MEQLQPEKAAAEVFYLLWFKTLGRAKWATRRPILVKLRWLTLAMRSGKICEADWLEAFRAIRIGDSHAPASAPSQSAALVWRGTKKVGASADEIKSAPRRRQSRLRTQIQPHFHRLRRRQVRAGNPCYLERRLANDEPRKLLEAANSNGKLRISG